MRLTWLVSLVLACGLVGPAAARPDAAAIKKANGHFKLGQEFFKSGQWDRAIAEYQAALDLTGEPLMLFNLALAHDRADRHDQALELYRRYLEQVPDGAIADEARQYVARLTVIVDERRAREAAEEARRAEAARAAEEARRAREQAARQAALAERARAERTARAAEIDRGARLRRWGGIAAGATGLVAFGVAVAFGVEASSIADEVSAHEGAWTDAQIDRAAEGQSASTKMIVFTTLGGAELITGGVLYAMGRRESRRAEQLRVGAAVLPGGAGVALGGGF